MKKYLNLAFIALIFLAAATKEIKKDLDSTQTLLTHKTPTCGCCKEWVKHAEDNGFNVYTQDHQNLEDIKKMYSIQAEYRSCHTSVSTSGFIFEGHIPIKYITQFLSEDHSNAIGLSVPGMPLGSPGMEFDDRFAPYDVLILYKDGTSNVYAQVNR